MPAEPDHRVLREGQGARAAELAEPEERAEPQAVPVVRLAAQREELAEPTAQQELPEQPGERQVPQEPQEAEVHRVILSVLQEPQAARWAALVRRR